MFSQPLPTIIRWFLVLVRSHGCFRLGMPQWLLPGQPGFECNPWGRNRVLGWAELKSADQMRRQQPLTYYKCWSRPVKVMQNLLF